MQSTDTLSIYRHYTSPAYGKHGLTSSPACIRSRLFVSHRSTRSIAATEFHTSSIGCLQHRIGRINRFVHQLRQTFTRPHLEYCVLARRLTTVSQRQVNTWTWTVNTDSLERFHNLAGQHQLITTVITPNERWWQTWSTVSRHKRHNNKSITARQSTQQRHDIKIFTFKKKCGHQVRPTRYAPASNDTGTAFCFPN